MDLKTITDQLNAIKTTRLFCNSPEELAERTGIPSLVNNNNFDKVGEDRRIAVYESFNEEYRTCVEMSSARLDDLMTAYEKTSEFYIENELAKRASLFEKDCILEIMRCIFYSHELPKGNKKLSDFIADIYDHETDKFKRSDIDICILLLIGYKIIPTYKSRKGAVTDIEADFRKVKDLLETFHSKYALTEDNLSIKSIEQRISDETIKLNRLTLITMFKDVVYSVDASTDRTLLSDSYRYFDIEGVWVDKINPDTFYEIFLGFPAYTMNVYELNSTEAKFTKFSLEILIDEEDSLTLFTTHPRGRARVVLNRINGTNTTKLGRLDYSSHHLEFDDYKTPSEIILKDIERHPNYDFQGKIFYKLSDEDKEEFYELLSLKTQKELYEEYKSEYIADSRIYAITRDFIYIIPHEEESNFLYRIPRDRYIDDYILRINVDDTAGLAIIAQEGPFIGFEDIGLYLDIRTEEKMSEAGIECVSLNDIR